MKKITLILFLFLITTKVNALEYGIWTDEYIQEENIRVVASETRYKWYKDNTIFSPNYYIEGENDYQYPYISNDDVIYTDWSSWSDIKPDTKINRSIELKSANRYRMMRPIRYLFISDLTSFTSITKVAEMKVLINNKKIPINVTCTNCSLTFDKLATDGYFTGGAYIYDGAVVTIDLGDYFNINEIGLEMFVYSDVYDTKTFNVYYNEGSTIDDRNYVKRYVYFTVGEKEYYEADRYYVIPEASFVTNPIFNDWIYIDGWVNSTYYRQMQAASLYRYKDIKYRYYGIERSYLNGYYSSIDDSSYTMEESSAKTFYLYEYVNPLVDPITDSEEDETVIDSPSTDPEDVETSTDNQPPDLGEGGVADDVATDIEEESTDEEIITIDNKPIIQNEEEIIAGGESKLTLATEMINKDEEENKAIDIPVAVDNTNIKSMDKSIANKNGEISKITTKEKKKLVKANENIVVVFSTIITSRIFLICFSLILFICIAIYKLRHHILSHQN